MASPRCPSCNSGLMRYLEREKTMKPDGRTDVKVEIVMWMFKGEAKVIQMVLM